MKRVCENILVAVVSVAAGWPRIAAAAYEYTYLCDEGCGPGVGPIEIILGAVFFGWLVHLWVISSKTTDARLWKVGILAVVTVLFLDSGRWVAGLLFAAYATWAFLLTWSDVSITRTVDDTDERGSLRPVAPPHVVTPHGARSTNPPDPVVQHVREVNEREIRRLHESGLSQKYACPRCKITFALGEVREWRHGTICACPACGRSVNVMLH